MRDIISNMSKVDLGKDTLAGVTPNASAWLDTRGYGGAALVTADGDDNIVVGVLGYNGSKRYIRLNYVGTTGTDAIVRTIGRMGKPHTAPTTYVGTSVAAT